MKGDLHFSFLGGIILVLLVVLIGSLLIGQVSAFDAKKYFGLQPILGEVTTPSAAQTEYAARGEVSTPRCQIFTSITGSFDAGTDCTEISKSGGTTVLNVCKFYSPACTENTYAVGCSFEVNSGETFDKTFLQKYGSDEILSYYIDESKNRCILQTSYGTEHSIGVDVLCAEVQPTEKEYKWGSLSNPSMDPSTLQYTLTGGANGKCSNGFTPIFSMVDSDNVISYNFATDTILNLSIDRADLWDWDPNPRDFNKRFGQACIKSSLLSACNLKIYNQTSSKGIAKSDTFQLKQAPCPGDSQLLSCFGGSTDAFIELSSSGYLIDAKNGGMPIQTCKMIDMTTMSDAYMGALCAENIWYWSDWIPSSNSYPTFEKDCPTDYKAIGCASDTASFENGYGGNGGGNYGDDMLNSFYFATNNAGCIVSAKDNSGNTEHLRRVGALCIDKDTFSTDFKTLSPKTFDDTGKKTWSDNSITVTVESNACDTGYEPVYCTIDMSSQSAFQKDAINEVYVDTTARTCKITIRDEDGSTYSGNNFGGVIGGLCAKTSFVITKQDWKAFSATIEHKNPFFKGDTCANGIATMATTKTDEAGNFKEDPIISMVPQSNLEGFVVQAEDNIGCFIACTGGNVADDHRRQVGAVCVVYGEEVWPTSATGSTSSGSVTWTLSVTGSYAGQFCAIYHDPNFVGPVGANCNNNVKDSGEYGVDCGGTSTCGSCISDCATIGNNKVVTLTAGKAATLMIIPGSPSAQYCCISGSVSGSNICSTSPGTYTIDTMTAISSGTANAQFYTAAQ